MVSISVLTPIVAACAVLAWCLVLKRNLYGYITIGTLLTWWTAHVLVRAANQIAILVPTRDRIGPDAPYEGAARLAYYIELSLRLSWPFAILAACLAMFLRRRPWWVVPLWALFAGAFCFFYPELRRRPQSYVETAVAASCWIASVWCVWKGHRRLRIDLPECYMPTALILGAQLAVILVVQFAGQQQNDWSIARAIQSFAYGGLLLYLAAKLWRPEWMR